MPWFSHVFSPKRRPTIYLGDVQMKLEWSLLSEITGGPGYPGSPEPSPQMLRDHFSSFLELPILDSGSSSAPGDRLFHLAIVDLRQGIAGIARGPGFDLPLLLRPSVTVQGYLLDIETGNVLAEDRLTQKPGWMRYRNPSVLGPHLLFGTDPAGAKMVPPLCETAVVKMLLRLKRQAGGKT